jgi:sigma-54-dependent transcriptional regulator
LVERAVLLCEGGELLAGHFSLPVSAIVEGSSLHLRERLERVERSLVIDCLRKNNGNQTLAARELGLPRRTLLYRLGRLNIRSGDLGE